MVHRKGKDTLSYLDPHERAEVLGQILSHHPELRNEANSIARDLLDDTSVAGVSGHPTSQPKLLRKAWRIC